MHANCERLDNVLILQDQNGQMLSSEALNSLFQLAAGSQGDTSGQGNQVGSSSIPSQVRVAFFPLLGATTFRHPAQAEPQQIAMPRVPWAATCWSPSLQRIERIG